MVIKRQIIRKFALMFPLRAKRLFTALLLIAVFLSEAVASEKTDTLSSGKRKGLLASVIEYFDKSNKRELGKRPNFTPLGGPHYSSEKGLGLGLVIAGDYSTCPSDSTLPASNVSIVGDIATKGYFSTGIRGVHVYPSHERRINYNLKFQSFSTYFWGMGYEWGNNKHNKTKYKLFDLTLSADYEWNIANGLFLGPAIEVSYTNAHDIEDYRPWQGQKTHYMTAAAGGRLQYDLRDNLTYPHRGMLLELTQLFAPRFFGNSSHAFMSTDVAFNFYTPVWKDGILATRFHSEWTVGRTPWSKLAFLGGDSMRAYYEGRYRDKCASDITVELRQKIYRRSGIAVWCGVGTVYHNFSDIRFKRLLPEAGIGYRWEFKKNSNVRMDIAVGKHSTGFLFGLNEAF